MENKLTKYNGNFVKCSKKIAKAGEIIATAREGMIERIARRKTSRYESKGCWHSEGTANIDGVTYWCLAEYAPTTQNIKRTYAANFEGLYLPLISNVKIRVESALELIPRIAAEDKNKLPEQRRVLIPEMQDTFIIDSAEFGNIDIARFLARDATLAKDYSHLLDIFYGTKFTSFYQLAVDENSAAGVFLGVVGDVSHFTVYGTDGDFSDSNGRMFGTTAKSQVIGLEKKAIKPTPKQLAIIEQLLMNRPKK
ncbi:MAG: hypothetical protein WCI72_00590 [archaeon]